jgi:acetyl-CoA acetyltransferase family protein
VNAKKARDAGHFDEEIEPVVVEQGGSAEPITVKYDTHILENPSLEGMAKLPPAFEANGVITAGNASAVVDSAAAMVLGLESDAQKHGLRPLCRIIGYGVAGVDPHIMGIGPVPASRIALKKAGLKGHEIDIVEINEAFSPQSLACARDFEAMGIDPEKINPMGNAIALGHPLGATGAILTLTCAYALRRRELRYGLVTMCIGGGQGIALILESIH